MVYITALCHTAHGTKGYNCEKLLAALQWVIDALIEGA
jgi:hypothetical protein